MPRGFSAACSLDPLLQCSLHAGGSHAQGAALGCCFGNASFPFLGPEAFPSVRAPGGPWGLGSSRSDSLMPGSCYYASVRTLHARNTLYSPCHNPVTEHKLWGPIARMVVHVPPSSLACSLDLNFIPPYSPPHSFRQPCLGWSLCWSPSLRGGESALGEVSLSWSHSSESGGTSEQPWDAVGEREGQPWPRGLSGRAPGGGDPNTRMVLPQEVLPDYPGPAASSFSDLEPVVTAVCLVRTLCWNSAFHFPSLLTAWNQDLHWSSCIMDLLFYEFIQ